MSYLNKGDTFIYEGIVSGYSGSFNGLRIEFQDSMGETLFLPVRDVMTPDEYDPQKMTEPKILGAIVSCVVLDNPGIAIRARLAKRNPTPWWFEGKDRAFWTSWRDIENPKLKENE